MRSEELAAKLLGLIPPDMDLVGSALEVMQEQVGGFYDHHEQRVFVVEGLNEGFAQTVLASELNLALDDQHFDVLTLLDAASTSTDASLALNAVYLVAQNRSRVLDNFWRKSNNAVDKGRTEAPYGWVVPADQARRADASYMLNLMQRQGHTKLKPLKI